MTSFINLEYSAQHSGANRVESVIDAAQQAGHRLSGTRGLSTLLLSAVAAAVMVVAYQVMDSVAEGHLMVMWMAMWFVAFAALALFADSARRMAVGTKRGLDAWSRGLAESRADQRLWAMAKADPRIMSDLQMVISRNEVDVPSVQSVRAVRALNAGAPLFREEQRSAV